MSQAKQVEVKSITIRHCKTNDVNIIFSSLNNNQNSCKFIYSNFSYIKQNVSTEGKYIHQLIYLSAVSI